jgi:GST-like protein
MLQLYTWKTPNGYKVPIMLEELGLEYEIHPVNISKGEQMTPEFLAMNPNNKIPVLVDEDATGGPLTLFESGAILEYLAEKSGKLMPKDLQGKYQTLEWLMFQMASVGPMFGQLAHFTRFAPEKIEYATKRYTDEAKRIMGVMDGQLGRGEYLAGEYSIADIATYPWVRAIHALAPDVLQGIPNVDRWYMAIDARAAVKTAYEKVDKVAVQSSIPLCELLAYKKKSRPLR